MVPWQVTNPAGDGRPGMACASASHCEGKAKYGQYLMAEKAARSGYCNNGNGSGAISLPAPEKHPGNGKTEAAKRCHTCAVLTARIYTD